MRPMTSKTSASRACPAVNILFTLLLSVRDRKFSGLSVKFRAVAFHTSITGSNQDSMRSLPCLFAPMKFLLEVGPGGG